jgi:hypothetical protein
MIVLTEGVRSTSCKPNSTPSPTNTTTAGPTDPCPTEPSRPPTTPASPKPDPATRIDTHDRVRTDRIGETGNVTLRVNGRLHHIGVGRIHHRTRVLILAHDLNIKIINAATGEVLRDFTLDPTRDYQPTGAPKGPTRK